MVCSAIFSSAMAAKMMSSSGGVCALSVSSMETSAMKLPGAFGLGDVAENRAGILHRAQIFSCHAGDFGAADVESPVNPRNLQASGSIRDGGPRKPATPPPAPGWPMESATSIVKKSDESRKPSTVSSRIWSASTCHGFFQPSSATAFSAAARTLAGLEPMMACSRLDLFQTGVTSTPWLAAMMTACNWALA